MRHLDLGFWDPFEDRGRWLSAATGASLSQGRPGVLGKRPGKEGRTTEMRERCVTKQTNIKNEGWMKNNLEMYRYTVCIYIIYIYIYVYIYFYRSILYVVVSWRASD